MLVVSPSPARKPGMVALAPPLRLESEMPPSQEEGPGGEGQEDEYDLVDAGDMGAHAVRIPRQGAPRLPLRSQPHHVTPRGHRCPVTDAQRPPFRTRPLPVHPRLL